MNFTLIMIKAHFMIVLKKRQQNFLINATNIVLQKGVVKQEISLYELGLFGRVQKSKGVKKS